MKNIILIIFISLLPASAYLKAQDDKAWELYEKYDEYFKSNDLIRAEDYLLSILDLKDSVSSVFLISVYNNLGVIYMYSGRYYETLESYSKAENLIINHTKNLNQLASVYNNKAIIYRYQKSYPLAIEYYEKGIRIFSTQEDSVAFQNLSKSYQNIGLIYLDIGDFNAALDYLNKSAGLKIKYGLEGLDNVNYSLANAFSKTGNHVKAEEYFQRSISGFERSFGKNYFRLAEVYKDYGIFLKSIDKNSQSLEYLRNALSVYHKNYKSKHPQISKSYTFMGDYFLNLNDYDSALIYYQKSLIAVSTEFNDQDIFSNPSIDSSLSDIQLLECLKNKAIALELLEDQYTDQDRKIKILSKSLETIDLAIELIDRIRNHYPSEQSKMYLAENEKETYIFATHLSLKLFNLKPEIFTPEQVYYVASKAKAAILRNEIAGNDLLKSAEVPDSLRKKQARLAEDIAAYNFLIHEELRKANPEEKKLNLWKDELFNMNRESEKVFLEINQAFPEYRELLQMTEPNSLAMIRSQLDNDETVIDYLLSNRYNNATRKLFTFIITRNSIEFRETNLDSTFAINADNIRTGSKPGRNKDFKSYTGALNYMYECLIKPSEDLFKGQKIIIIPDEEIAWLPFDAFLRSKPEAHQADYEGLPYLIKDYVFSYGYSSSLISGKNKISKKHVEVYSFSPDYSHDTINAMGLGILRGAGKEIESIYHRFKGRKFTGTDSSEKNFREAAEKYVVFHLAMHALPDSSNPGFSYFLFDKGGSAIDDGKLYNYEISLTRLNSPMVVLSACNSGTGALYQGEGMMSLARGFMLAGASSIVKTAWDVNDEVSAKIISRFYFHLSKGMEKDEAMRLAKLEYLETAVPSQANPYFWAAYEVMGDNAPVTKRNRSILLFAIILFIMAIILAGYLIRRKIFSDRLQ